MDNIKNGVWVNKEKPEIKIYIERVYKKKDYIDFFYYMCELVGGGRISKEDLLKHYLLERG